MSESNKPQTSRSQARLAKERVATRLGARNHVNPTDELEELSMSPDRFVWLNHAACADLEIDDFFVPAGHAISEEKLNVCRSCPVRSQCLDHAYASTILNGYFGGMSPGQRRQLSLDQARRFIATDHPKS